jgi:hypothetical protein
MRRVRTVKRSVQPDFAHVPEKRVPLEGSVSARAADLRTYLEDGSRPALQLLLDPDTRIARRRAAEGLKPVTATRGLLCAPHERHAVTELAIGCGPFEGLAHT